MIRRYFVVQAVLNDHALFGVVTRHCAQDIPSLENVCENEIVEELII